MDLVSQKAPKNPDSNDSSPISVSLKTKKLFKFFLHRTQPEQTIINGGFKYHTLSEEVYRTQSKWIQLVYSETSE